MVGLVLLAVYAILGIIACIVMDVKLDWTEDKELIIWYTITDEFTGTKERRFYIIFKR